MDLTCKLSVAVTLQNKNYMEVAWSEVSIGYTPASSVLNTLITTH